MYPKASIAEKLLALCNDPVVGFYAVRLSTSGASTSTRVQQKLCPAGTAQAGTLQPGGGWEQIAIAPQQAVQFYPVLTDTTP